jgi:zinc transport system substrate-binding protein
MRRLFFALAVFLAVGCSKQGGGVMENSRAPDVAPTKKLVVVATIAPMYCFARNVAGDLADVEMIVPAGVSPRGFQPSPDQLSKISAADVVVENGFGFEPWMDKLEAAGLKPGAVRVIAARGTGPGIPGLPGDPNTAPGDAPVDPSKPVDPHVWLDPLMAIKEAQNIRDALAARDPAHADEYFANENRYEATLRDLDVEVGQMTVDISRRRLVCVGDAFSYFLSRYQFAVAGVVQTGAEAASAAREKKADGVIAPAGTGILNINGLRVVIADPMENGPASADFYERQTRANTAALRQGLMQ